MRTAIILSLSLAAIEIGSNVALARVTTLRDCGLKGTIEERIADCAKETSYKNNGAVWDLVSSVTVDGKIPINYQVWQDFFTGLIWSDLLDTKFSYDQAIQVDENYCTQGADNFTKNCKVIRQIACVSEEGKRAEDGITDHQFELPTLEQFTLAESDGIREVLPNTNYTFLSSSLNSTASADARGYENGALVNINRTEAKSVLCVAR
jgi:hypothetical protein